MFTRSSWKSLAQSRWNESRLSSSSVDKLFFLTDFLGVGEFLATELLPLTLRVETFLDPDLELLLPFFIASLLLLWFIS
jgi:hypothetical protein